MSSRIVCLEKHREELKNKISKLTHNTFYVLLLEKVEREIKIEELKIKSNLEKYNKQ